MNFLDKNKFPALNFPFYPLKITIKGKRPMVWDTLRQMWLLLTPEEWVRQHVLCYMIEELGFSRGLIKQEHPVEVGTATNQRIDILGYGDGARALLLVECKASGVKIDGSVFDQAVRYNSVIGARYVMLTNGLSHYFFEFDGSTGYSKLGEVPIFFG